MIRRQETSAKTNAKRSVFHRSSGTGQDQNPLQRVANHSRWALPTNSESSTCSMNCVVQRYCVRLPVNTFEAQPQVCVYSFYYKPCLRNLSIIAMRKQFYSIPIAGLCVTPIDVDPSSTEHCKCKNEKRKCEKERVVESCRGHFLGAVDRFLMWWSNDVS